MADTTQPTPPGEGPPDAPASSEHQETEDQDTSEREGLAEVKSALAKANAEAAKFRHELAELRPLAERAKAAEEATKTETERLAEALAEAKTSGERHSSELAKLRVALAKAPAGIELARIEALASRLQGSTVEELEADAAELFAQLAPAPTTSSSATRPPVEALKPGTLPPTAEEVPLPQQIAAAEAAGEWERARELKALQLVQLHEKQRSS